MLQEEDEEEEVERKRPVVVFYCVVSCLKWRRLLTYSMSTHLDLWLGRQSQERRRRGSPFVYVSEGGRYCCWGKKKRGI